VSHTILNGTIAITASQPEIALSLEATSIADGQVVPVDFGSVQIGGTGSTRTFTVRNDGTATLTLGTVTVPSRFTVTEGLPASLTPGASDTFQVRLDSAIAGSKNGSISLANNDSDENPFDFPVTGMVVTQPTAVSVVAFQAILDPHGQVQLHWSTGVEFDLLGFRVERRSSGGASVRLGAGLIPARGNPQAAEYALADLVGPGVVGGSYRLVEVDLQGRERSVLETTVKPGITIEIAMREGGFVVEARGASGARVVLERAADVVRGPWIALQAITFDRTGAGSFVVKGDAAEPAQFYRLRID